MKSIHITIQNNFLLPKIISSRSVCAAFSEILRLRKVVHLMSLDFYSSYLKLNKHNIFNNYFQ